jgi:membrane protein implicated in regulation of membrane protease activity
VADPISHARAGQHQGMATPRFMVILFAATGVVVAAVAALALKSWLLLFGVLALHAVATAFVVGLAWRRAGDTSDKPDPVTEARIEEEGDARPGRYPRAGAGTS